MEFKARQNGKTAAGRKAAVLEQVSRERRRQVQLWGHQEFEQPSAAETLLGWSWTRLAELLKGINDDRQARGLPPSLAGVLLEEVFEALAEPDVEKRAEELVQVAAVAVSAVEDLRSRS